MFVNEDNAKQDERSGYRDVLEKIRAQGVCPFCQENLTSYHKNPILREGKFWLLTDNMYPYKGAKHHILLIHQAHIESILEITPEAWAELGVLVQEETKKRGILGGTFYLRFGNTRSTGASVTHLHANIIAPDAGDPNREPIMTRVG